MVTLLGFIAYPALNRRVIGERVQCCSPCTLEVSRELPFQKLSVVLCGKLTETGEDCVLDDDILVKMLPY